MCYLQSLCCTAVVHSRTVTVFLQVLSSLKGPVSRKDWNRGFLQWNGPTEVVNWHSESWLLLLWEYNHGLAGKHGVTSFYDLIAALVPYMCNRAWHGHGVIENILFLCLLSCCFPWFCAESLWPSRLSSVLCRLLIVWVILHAHFLLSWVEVSFFSLSE